MADKKSGEVGKRIVFAGETWRAQHQLSLETMRSTQELADEALHDLQKKHHRPTSLKEMLRQSACGDMRRLADAEPDPGTRVLLKDIAKAYDDLAERAEARQASTQTQSRAS